MASLREYEMDEGLVSTNEMLRWQAIMLRRMLVADEASEAYERKKPVIEEHHRERIKKLDGSVTDFALRKAMEGSWVLNDLLKKHAWNRDEANRYNNAITAQWALRRMLTEENEAQVHEMRG